jgi:hypothetical protein
VVKEIACGVYQFDLERFDDRTERAVIVCICSDWVQNASSISSMTPRVNNIMKNENPIFSPNENAMITAFFNYDKHQ